MQKKPDKKPKRAPNPFDFCPKHSVFYQSCGCPIPGTSRHKKEVEPEDDGTYVEERQK